MGLLQEKLFKAAGEAFLFKAAGKASNIFWFEQFLYNTNILLRSSSFDIDVHQIVHDLCLIRVNTSLRRRLPRFSCLGCDPKMAEAARLRATILLNREACVFENHLLDRLALEAVGAGPCLPVLPDQDIYWFVMVLG